MLGDYLPSVILASQSQGRREILEREGVRVTVLPTLMHEMTKETDAGMVTEDLAMQKLRFFLRAHPSPPLPVIAGDTIIGFEGKLVGKAKDEEEARAQLRAFSGKRQTVASSFALYYQGKAYHGRDEAYVWFKDLSEDDIAAYLATGEWRGAAGSYRIQKGAHPLILRVEGSMDTVIGLPTEKILAIMASIAPVSGAKFPSLRG